MWWASPYYAIKNWIVYLVDRFVECCDDLSVDSIAITNLSLRRAAQTLLLGLGGAARLVGCFPRLSVYRLSGPRFSVVYIGELLRFEELLWLLFPDGVSVEQVERVPLWRVPDEAKCRLREADLVVCGLGRLHPAAWRPSALYSFVCPVWVDQTLDICQSLERILSGDAAKRLLWRKSRKAVRAGYTPRFTRDRDDFEYFYHQLHEPHIRRRHGTRALISSAEAHWHCWVEGRGELLVVEKDGVIVAGMTIRYVGSTCLLGVEGVADWAGSDLYHLDIQSALRGFAIERAREQGATQMIMGGSLARCADRVFISKRRWGATAIPKLRSGEIEWTFLAEQITGALRTELNAKQLVSFVNGQAYVVQIEGQADEDPMSFKGVAGILRIGPSRPGLCGEPSRTTRAQPAERMLVGAVAGLADDGE
ncbi:MAG: hypothetical protein ACYC4L_03150 [Chloroflexota bacterium]